MDPEPLNPNGTLLANCYQIGALIGTGGFGSVYLGMNTQTQSQVAIKHLRQTSPERLFRFKREFRMLADCAHRNLIRYHQFLERRGQWYLVMEYINGPTLVEYVRGGHWSASQDPTRSVIGERSGRANRSREAGARWQGDDDFHPDEPGFVAASHMELVRIRAILPQLADGLTHLHQAGIVHRDLKPRNILVDGTGRVVILDFGLALQGQDLAQVGRYPIGTPGYMAPEQAVAQPASAASDWYSVGIMLYEMLLGHTPLPDCPVDSSVANTPGLHLPADPRTFFTDLPDDLCDLCMALLAPDPDARPKDAAERLRRCGEVSSSRSQQPQVGHAFVGRMGQLQRMQQARIAWEDNHAGAVLVVHGPSGIGKTSLVDHFVQQGPPGSLVLRARCYQRESVPFNALDGLAESLCEHLQRMDAARVKKILPKDITDLAHLLPTLQLVPEIKRIVRGTARFASDPLKRRSNAINALRSLLHNLAQHRRLVMVIDDMHWADHDSIASLIEVLSPPAAPAILLIATILAEDEDDVTTALASAFGQARVAITALALEPLSEPESFSLIEQMLSGEQDQSDLDPMQLYRESAGHPLLLRELVLSHLHQPRATAGKTLQEIIEQRLAALPSPARQLLACAAVAGRPQSIAVLARATGDPLDLPGLLHQLCADRLLRYHIYHGRSDMVVVHKHIGEITLSSMDAAEQRQHHRALAQALAAEGEAEANAVFEHWLAADEPALAFPMGLIAGARAMQSGACSHAVRIYQYLLQIAPAGENIADLRLRLADALSNSGNSAAAAKTYVEVAADPDYPDRVHALQRAAGQYLRSGHIDDGIRCAREVMQQIDVRWSEQPAAALAHLTRGRLNIWWRGIGTHPHLATAEPLARLRMDALWSIGYGLAWVDQVRGAELNIRHTEMALACGDPMRISRGLAWEAIQIAREGGPGSRQRAHGLLEAGQDLAVHLPDDHALAWCHSAEAYLAWSESRWDDAIASCTRAAHLFTMGGSDGFWELGSLAAFCWLPSLYHTGRMSELRERLTAVEDEACQRGDLHTLVTIRTTTKPWVTLASGDPDSAWRDVEDALTRWSRRDWHLQHLFALTAKVHIALYWGDAPTAWRLLNHGWPRFKSSMQIRLQSERVTMLYLHGQVGVMMVPRGVQDGDRINEIRGDIALLEQEASPLSQVQAQVLHAAVLALQGHITAAMEHYHLAAAGYEQLAMPLQVAGCRRRAAELGDDDGDLRRADAELYDLGISEPGDFTAAIIAGRRHR
jgi:serine/threonine protein kinase/tetratricopeptide (TPR) repeat protein